MKNSILIYTKLLICIELSFSFFNSQAQPKTFSWNNRHGYDYISSAKDQKEQGPCGIFATVAAVEAIAQIYFNTTGSELNLSESNLYSSCGIVEFPAPQALAFFTSNGVIDETHWPFPEEYVNDPPWRYFLPSPACEAYDSYTLKVKIPKWGYSYEGNSTLTINNNEDLKKAILDYGPIIIMGDGSDQYGKRLGGALHPSDVNVNHTVLITGWDSTISLKWEIKDSWPSAISDQRLVEINLFNYNPHFYCIYPVFNDNGTLNYLTVKDSNGSNVYTQLNAVDIDKDGFYRWGLESYPPSLFNGCERMDYDDSDPNTIFLDAYNPLPAPYISDTLSKYVCTGGKYFTLTNFTRLSELGFSVQWNVTPSYYFTSSTTGYTSTAFLNPSPSFIGKNCKIEFLLKYDGSTIKTYKFQFLINGPQDSLVSTSVLDSYGVSALGGNDFFYICPNTNYTIYYNNGDYGCNTSSFSWTLPYGWTENYSYLHYISINTNEYPYGYLQIYANTCCGSSFNVKNIYFSEAECGEYFVVYPNPSNDFVDIDIGKERLPYLDFTKESCIITLIDGAGITKLKTRFTGFPYRLNLNNLPDGLYILNINTKDIKSTMQLLIKH